MDIRDEYPRRILKLNIRDYIKVLRNECKEKNADSCFCNISGERWGLVSSYRPSGGLWSAAAAPVVIVEAASSRLNKRQMRTWDGGLPVQCLPAA